MRYISLCQLGAFRKQRYKGACGNLSVFWYGLHHSSLVLIEVLSVLNITWVTEEEFLLGLFMVKGLLVCDQWNKFCVAGESTPHLICLHIFPFILWLL